MRSSRIIPLLLVLGLVSALAGCGVRNTIDPVAAAATKTQAAGGMKMTMLMSITGGPSQETYSMTATGAFDGDHGEMTMDLSSMLEAAGLPSGSGDVKFLYLPENGDEVMYMSFPALSNELPGGKAWIKVDLEKAGKSLGVDLNQLMNGSGQNPAQTLDMLRASGQVDEVGPATIDGVQTTEYKATIDLAQAAKLHGLSGDLVQRLTAAGGPGTIPVEVWIGDDGLVRQLKMSEQLKSGDDPVSADITINLSDFGTDVSVSAPPADQVFDASGLLGGLGSGQTTTSSLPIS